MLPTLVYAVIHTQCSLTFWTAAFPGLAHDLPEVGISRGEVDSGAKS